MNPINQLIQQIEKVAVGYARDKIKGIAFALVGFVLLIPTVIFMILGLKIVAWIFLVPAIICFLIASYFFKKRHEIVPDSGFDFEKY